jgi:hypothetical protein
METIRPQPRRQIDGSDSDRCVAGALGPAEHLSLTESKYRSTLGWFQTILGLEQPGQQHRLDSASKSHTSVDLYDGHPDIELFLQRRIQVDIYHFWVNSIPRQE